MIQDSIHTSPYKGSGQITREQFLFYEMRTTAKLLIAGHDDEDTIDTIIRDNLFQYPTEKSVKQMAKVCVERLKCLQSDELIGVIATADSVTAKQTCLYAMMKKYRVVRDFMITVIGEKYKQRDYSFGRGDIRAFFLRLQEQDDYLRCHPVSRCFGNGSGYQGRYLGNGSCYRCFGLLIDRLLD